MKRRLLFALITSVIITAIIASGFLYTLDNRASDRLYQEIGLQTPDIIVIGIDQDTVAELGPSLRGATAQVIETLNKHPENRPAVIGIDMMFTGNNLDAPDADKMLADAAGIYDNVVVAADGKFGVEFEAVEGGAFSVSQQKVLDWYEPFPELNQVVSYGHVNEMLDADGIYRHAKLYVDTPENGRVFSFARVIYERWCREKGIEPAAAPEVSESGFYYLPFSQSADGYSDGFNFLQLYNGEVDPSFYRGKIVLIGAVYPGSGDEYFTSLDHASKIPGVVIQANIIEAFQQGFFPHEAGRTAQLAILFLICFLAALFLWDQKILPGMILWLGSCALWIAACSLLYSRASVILHVLWIPVGVSILFIASVALNYIHSRQEKKRVTDTFGYYIDPVIRDQLLSQGTQALSLGGTSRNIAVLFVDVRGFTSMSESLDAETVVEIVNRYLTLTTECIMNNHGTLDKFVGDCTMAIWNAPIEQEDPVYHACRAAMDMISASKTLETELMEKYGRSVSFGIGINWGPAVVGNIGAPRRLDYTAIGDTVNTAARLEEAALGGTVLISRAVADALGSRAETTSLGTDTHLKGKNSVFEVLELNGLS